MKIEKVFVLNIGTSIQDIKTKLDRGLPDAVWEILPGIKGVDTSREWSPFPTWKIEGLRSNWWGRELKEGEIGCALSHLQAWEKAHKEGWGCALFLEEDFIPKVFLGKLRLDLLPDNTDGFYLGRSKHPHVEEKEINSHWIKPGYSYQTHAYCLTRSGLEKILKYDYASNLIPSDEFLSAVFTKHPRGDVAEKFKPTLNFYASKNQYFIQSPVHLSQTEESSFISRG